MKKLSFIRTAGLVAIVLSLSIASQALAAVTATPVITSVIGTAGGTNPGYGYINSTGSTTVIVSGTAVGTSTIWAVLNDGVGGHAATSTQVLAPEATAFSVSVNGSTMDAGTVNVLVYALDTTGGASTSTAASTSTTKDIVVPTLTNVTMYTNNSSSTIAKSGNTVSVSATSSETISSPTITISKGGSVTVANPASNGWKGTATLSSSDTSGLVTFSVSFSDLAGNAGVTRTTLNNGVASFVYTAPSFTLAGYNPAKCNVYWTCADAGAVAVDSRGVSVTLSTLSNVSTSTAGNYTISYGGTDPAGNSATSTRAVYVVKKNTTTTTTTTTADDTTTTTNNTPATDQTTTVVTTTTNPTNVETTVSNNEFPVVVIKVSGISDTVKRQLKFGINGEDIKLLQTLLSHDSSIYPEGLVTGYFGNLTRKAVQRFQEKYGVAGSKTAGYGEVGPRTKAKLIELFGN